MQICGQILGGIPPGRHAAVAMAAQIIDGSPIIPGEGEEDVQVPKSLVCGQPVDEDHVFSFPHLPIG
jgi:hypothetical protein